MDVGFYLGELLMQQGEVSVPGLGYFVQVRVSGYYNDEERKFYPPYHQAQFDVQSLDDDALAEYIANKKNISVASARYFAEKYITNLKQEALIGEVPIGNLGWFYTELTQLNFRPADKIIDDTIFYGLEPISISKIGDLKPVEERPKVQLNYPPRLSQTPAVPETPKSAEPAIPEKALGSFETPVNPDPAIASADVTQTPISTNKIEPTDISSDFFEPVEEEEEEESKGPLKLILAILIVVVVIGLGVFAVYRYQPDTFAKIAFWERKAVVIDTIKPKEIVPAAADTTVFLDSTQVDTSGNKVDTVSSTPTSPKQTGVISQPVVTNKTTQVTPPTTAPAAKATVTTQPAATTKTTIVSPPKQAATISTVPIKSAAPTSKAGSTKVRSSDATNTRRFEVYVTPACKDMAEANQLIGKLRKNGLDARLVTDAPGPLIHVSIGHFKTAAEAKAFAIKAQESGKVTGDAYPNEIIPTARRFEVYVTPPSKDMAEANRLISKLRKNGLDPYIVSDAPGPLIQVSIGQFKTAQEAKAFAVKSQESGKVTGGAYANEIIPQ